MSKRVAVVVRDKTRQYEALRVSLGLLLERHAVTMCVLNHAIDADEAYLDNMELIDEMGGARYSNHQTNVSRWRFQPISPRALADTLQGCDVVIPF